MTEVWMLRDIATQVVAHQYGYFITKAGAEEFIRTRGLECRLTPTRAFLHQKEGSPHALPRL